MMGRVDIEISTQLGKDYAQAVRTAAVAGVAAEPEAQLTVPIDNFFTQFSAAAGLGDLFLIREAQLDGVRPDFAALINNRPCGWIELKAPGHTIDGDRWRGREKSQWELLAQLDSLIVTNGEHACLYVEGKPVAEAALPFDGESDWSPAELEHLLEMFTLVQVVPIKRVGQLADRLAPLARFLRLKLEEGLNNNRAAVLTAQEVWKATMPTSGSSENFASEVAQVVAYAMAIAGMTGQADRNNDGLVTLKEAKETLEIGHRNVLAAALGPITGLPDLLDYIRPELGAIERLVSSLDVPAIQASKDPRGEPWLWFYEDFLAKYDPAARDEAGVYYTPTNVVEYQVRTIDHLLRTKFNLRLGFGSDNVITLDPATGSGTYPLAVIDQAIQNAKVERGPAGARQIVKNLTKNMIAFELLPGPYAVAHLRIGQRLAEAEGLLMQTNEIGVYLTDTLEDPAPQESRGLFGDAKVLADADERARKIKAEQPVTVALGNPPYDRVTSDSGGWVLSGSKSQDPLFDDVIKPAQDRGVIFSAQASLYNLYVYFWRWAIWKVFEQLEQERAIVSFITASSWLDGPAFVGLRQLAVKVASDIWILDLGGDTRGARKEDNVFSIQSPVAIVTLVRRGTAKSPARVRYRRLRGTRQEKFNQLDTIDKLDEQDGWTRLNAPNGEPFVPASTDEQWLSYPALTNLFPWQQPGIKYNRMWPVSPSREVLKTRWRELLRDESPEVRAEKYVTATTGRTIHTEVGRLPTLASLSSTDHHNEIVRIGWRSFDQQWSFDDPRLINLERPSLWQSVSDKQVFLVSPGTETLGQGPAMSVSVGVPDLHYFANRGGKDVIPLYRDQESEQPNITRGLLNVLSTRLNLLVTPEDLAAYCFAVVAHPGYTAKFWAHLEHAAVRVPLTADPELFATAVALGRELLWVQTGGKRFTDSDRLPGYVPRVPGIGWREAVATIPETMRDIRYDEETQRLHVGTGIVDGVRPEVWTFEISGMLILEKWLGARTRKGIGRAAGKGATPLDLIRPTEWEDEWNDELLDLLRMLTVTVDLRPQQEDLLQQITRGRLIDSADLPVPANAERQVPETLQRDFSQDRDRRLF